MTKVDVFDPPMCCPTGVCGPQIDPVLPKFAADLAWLQSQGVHVERFNLAQQPAAFIENLEVNELLKTKGPDCLPLIVVDGHVVGGGGYPPRELLAMWTGLHHRAEILPVVSENGSGCKSTGCC